MTYCGGYILYPGLLANVWPANVDICCAGYPITAEGTEENRCISLGDICESFDSCPGKAPARADMLNAPPAGDCATAFAGTYCPGRLKSSAFCPCCCKAVP